MFDKLKKWFRELFTSIPKEKMDKYIKDYKEKAKNKPYKK